MTSDTKNATLIKPSDAPPDKQAKFRSFRAYNRGLWNGPKRENKKLVRRQDDLHRFDAIASTFDLTDYQKSRAREQFETIDLGHFNKSSESVDDVVWAVCVLVANEDEMNGTRYWPHPDAGDDEQFEQFAEGTLGLDRGGQMSILQRVRPKTQL